MEVRRIKSNELQHMGTIGMKWGIRRYQNEDGSLTPAGRAHYGYGAPRAASVGTTTVVRKTKNANVIGDYASNSVGLQGYGQARAATTSIEKIKHKSINDINYDPIDLKKVTRGLEDKSIDSLRDLEITAIGADYCGFINNNRHDTSKLAARESQRTKSAVLGNAISPYIAENAPNKAKQLRKNIEDAIEYKNSESYKKRHR